ncbi:hypothetical protein [Micromonospora sp. RTP1Z1]|uniref:hypothetical protein n=1 Tax=Micromonospora sp. RTP1Z1 TaxID=2994043 RepID=UPI0029C8912C|nr:hypothetical protein [Micromonospora sp. RTP1Z1]
MVSTELAAGKSNGEFVAEPKDRVVPTGSIDWLDRQLGPLRKLAGQEPAYERHVDANPVAGRNLLSHTYLAS